MSSNEGGVLFGVPADKLRVDVYTRSFVDGRIEQEIQQAGRTLSRWVMNTRDEHIRKGLIKLGWTPPQEKS